MARKKRNTEAERIENDTDIASTMVLGLVWSLSRDRELCPLCVLDMVCEKAMDAEDKGYIRHGVLHEIDDAMPMHETVQ